MNGIRAGQAFVELLADNEPLSRGLRAAERRLKQFGAFVTRIGRTFATLGIAIAAPLVAATVHFAKTGDQLDKMSKRTGVAVETLSELGFAAEQSGSSLESVERGLRGMQRQLLQARRGSTEVTDALGMLGVSFADLEHLSTDQQFMLLADGLARIDDESLRAGLAMQIFGRSGAELLPLLEDGAGGIEALRQEARFLGIVLTGPQAKAAAEFTDAWNRVTRQIKMVVLEIGSALAPTLTDLAGRIGPIVRGVVDWAKANPEIVRTVFGLAAASLALGGVLLVLGPLITVVAGGFGLAASVIGLLFAGVSALLTPLGLLVAGIAAAGAAFLVFTKNGQGLVAGLKGFFGTIAGDAMEAFGGIKDALAQGDLALAGEIAMAALQLVFQRGLDGIKGLWRDFKEFVVGTLAGLQKDARKFLDNFVSNTDDALGEWSPFADAGGVPAGLSSAIDSLVGATSGIADAARNGTLLDGTDAQRARNDLEGREAARRGDLEQRLADLVEQARRQNEQAPAPAAPGEPGPNDEGSASDPITPALREIERRQNAAVGLFSDAAVSALADVAGGGESDRLVTLNTRMLQQLRDIARNTDAAPVRLT